MKVVQWDGNVATEERVALDLPLNRLTEVLILAMQRTSEDSVLDAVCHHLGKNRHTVGSDIDSWLKSGLPESQIRIAIGKAAKAKKWFKTIDVAEELGKIIAASIPTIQSSDLAQKLNQVATWAYGQ